jgi:hypothetical protein
MGKVVIMTLVSPDELVFRPTRKRSGRTAVNVTNSRRRSAHAPLRLRAIGAKIARRLSRVTAMARAC